MINKIHNLLSFLRRLYFRERVRRRAKECQGTLNVNFKTKVTSNTILGNNFNSNGLLILGDGGVIIGDNFHCGFGCVFLTENHNHMGEKIPYDSTYLTKDITVGDNVWLGINVTLLPGVKIGEGVIIQAGSVVVNDIPPLAIAGGHPARVFSQRDDKHYFNLKKNNCFH